jgi:hypothetical protein
MARLPVPAALAISAVLVAAGCAFHTSPADGLTFRAPNDWKPSPGILGYVQFWRSPTERREVLMLVKSPVRLKPDDELFSNDQFHDTVRDTKVLKRENVKICGNQPATLVEAEGSSASTGEHVLIDTLMTDVAGSSYFALYMRPFAAAPNPEALAALREVCAKP